MASICTTYGCRDEKEPTSLQRSGVPELPPGLLTGRVEAALRVRIVGGVTQPVRPHIVVDETDVDATGLIERQTPCLLRFGPVRVVLVVARTHRFLVICVELDCPVDLFQKESYKEIQPDQLH